MDDSKDFVEVQIPSALGNANTAVESLSATENINSSIKSELLLTTKLIENAFKAMLAADGRQTFIENPKPLDLDPYNECFDDILKLCEEPELPSRTLQKRLRALYETIRHHVLDQTNYFDDLPNREILVKEEPRMFWLQFFNRVDHVTLDKFWDGLDKYLNEVYSYKTGTNSKLFKDVVRATLGQRDGDIVTMKEFRDFNLRFGPFAFMYFRASSLCDITGDKLSWFLETGQTLVAQRFLKRPENSKVKFIVRFSSQSGCFVRQDHGAKTLIQNTGEGYRAQLRKAWSKPHPTIPEAVEQAWGMPVEWAGDQWKGIWEQLLYGVESDEYMRLKKEIGKPVTIAEVNEKLQKILVGQRSMRHHLTDIEQGVDSVHKDLHQLGIRLLTGLEATIPRLFIMIPDPELKKGTSVWDKFKNKASKAFTTKWKVIVLCEGTGKEGEDGEVHFSPHEGYDISLPKEWVKEAIPYVRVGVKVASVAVLVGSSGAVDLGFVDKLLDGLRVDDLRGLDLYLAEMEEMLTGSDAQELPQYPDLIIENYKKLRGLLKKSLPEEDLGLGKMAGLQLYWDPEKRTDRWVCEKHNHGLVARTSPSAVTEEEDKSDEPGAASPRKSQHDSTPSVQLVTQTTTYGDEDEDKNDHKHDEDEQPGNPKGQFKLSLTVDDDNDSPRPPISPYSSKHMPDSYGSYIDQLAKVSFKVTGSLEVEIISAKNLLNVDTPVLGNRSDAYCIIRATDITGILLESRETRVIMDSLAPKFKETFKWDLKRAVERVQIEIWDWNRVKSHTLLGHCQIRLEHGPVLEIEDDLPLASTPDMSVKAQGVLRVRCDYQAKVAAEDEKEKVVVKAKEKAKEEVQAAAKDEAKEAVGGDRAAEDKNSGEESVEKEGYKERSEDEHNDGSGAEDSAEEGSDVENPESSCASCCVIS